jgi:putative ABC transport system permease protein
LRFKSGGFSDDPTDMFAALRSGTLLARSGDLSGETYPRVTLDLNQNASYDAVKDSVEKLGYRTFSYVEQFKEIRRFFFYFNIALSIVGMIALVTASLGIVNTMVMSILERTREIGVLKSLGADDRDIRLLFLAESGMIGTVGAVLGIVAGWIISRIASIVAKIVMERQGIPEMDMFTLPWWLVAIALVFGLLVSLGAGLYPASRAARVDPVQALRNE